MSAMLIILILTACAAVPVLPAALDFDSLTPEQFDETIRNNPEAYENWLDCQNDKTKCEHSGKNLEDAELQSKAELLAELNSKSWFFSFRRPSLASILALLKPPKNSTDAKDETIFVRA
uniref:GTPase-activating protein CdGAPr n=1 Tax=Lygus hesperus TaxID=30085 RepID=A0A0A9YQZ9_LYGHE